MTTRVLVCGGRKYTNREKLNDVLFVSNMKFHISVLIHGCAPDWEIAQTILSDLIGYRKNSLSRTQDQENIHLAIKALRHQTNKSA